MWGSPHSIPISTYSKMNGNNLNPTNLIPQFLKTLLKNIPLEYLPVLRLHIGKIACPMKLGSPNISSSLTTKRRYAKGGLMTSTSNLTHHTGFKPLSAKIGMIKVNIAPARNWNALRSEKLKDKEDHEGYLWEDDKCCDGNVCEKFMWRVVMYWTPCVTLSSIIRSNNSLATWTMLAFYVHYTIRNPVPNLGAVICNAVKVQSKSSHIKCNKKII